MAKYQSVPTIVEAHHYTGPGPEFAAWLLGLGGLAAAIEPVGPGADQPWTEPDYWLRLLTKQGQWVPCKVGEWIIQESDRSGFYPSAAEVFAARYVEAES